MAKDWSVKGLIVLLQIYKVLNFSSKLKEKYVCDPIDAMRFVIPSRYFYNVTSPARRLAAGPVKTRQGFDFSNFFDFGITNPPDATAAAADSTTEIMMATDDPTQMTTTEMIIETGFSITTMPPELEKQPFTAEEQASYNLAALICKLPKRKLITDAEFLTKQIDYAALNNYVRTSRWSMSDSGN